MSEATPRTPRRRIRAVSLALVACSCTPHLQNQSAESEELRIKVVPQLMAWAKSDSKELNLRTQKTLQGFDHVCYLWEYHSYRRIEDLVGPIESYFGSYDRTLVPENQMAFVAVRGKHAHVAHMPIRPFSIGRAGDKNCVVLEHARLIKEPNGRGGHVLARLKEVKDASARSARSRAL